MTSTNEILQRLFNNLNTVFNKDPKKLAAFYIKTKKPSQMVVQLETLTFTYVGETTPFLQISLIDPTNSAKTLNIGQLYNLLAANSNVLVEGLSFPFSGLGSIALIEDTYNLSNLSFSPVYGFTSYLWSVLKPLAAVLYRANQDLYSAFLQLGFATASEMFLDYWGNLFNIPRYPNEPDYEYSNRLLWETIKPRLNNIAIEAILKQGINFDAKIIDFSPKMMLTDGFANPTLLGSANIFADDIMVTDGFVDNATLGQPEDTTKYTLGNQYNFCQFGVYVDVPLNSSYYTYTDQQIEEIVNRNRAAGTYPWFYVYQVAREVFNTLETVSVLLSQQIDQELNQGKTLMFGHPDYTFYTDHWSASNITVMPWYQNNLQIPSLTDGVVLETQQVKTPPTFTVVPSAIFNGGYLSDGYLGQFQKFLCITDGPSETDVFDNVVPVYNEFQTGVGNTVYSFSPAVLSYQRYTDEPFVQRIDETVGDDTFSINVSNITGPVKALLGNQPLGTSSSVVFTTPVKVLAPVTISGLAFNEVQLEIENIHVVPNVIPNLDINDFGDNWNQNFSLTRAWIVPYQDIYGNRYYETIVLPALYPPPVEYLRILNPTSSITVDNVLIVQGQNVTITWNSTNGQSVNIIQRNIVTQTETTIAVGYSGSITYDNFQYSSEFIVSVLGNNNQISSSSIYVYVVAEAAQASAPTITFSALPDVCVLCNNTTSVINYDIVFNSKQTEIQTVAVGFSAESITISPLSSDPAGTVILNTRTPMVIRTADGLSIAGSWNIQNTNTATFYPIDIEQIQGYSFEIDYDVNYGGSSLTFDGAPIPLGNEGELFQISQQAIVALPAPPSVNGSPASSYISYYKITASNYASTATVTIPIYISSIVQSGSTFQVTSISPNSLVEAIGNTANEVIPITVNGIGYSNNMQVYTVQPIQMQNGLYTGQYIQCPIISLDWQNNILVFIAPLLTEGRYPLIVQKLNCSGEVVASDYSQNLLYRPSTYRQPPSISYLTPSAICITSTFTSQQISVTGNNFRPGALFYIIVYGDLIAQPTTVVNDQLLLVTIEYTSYGQYDVIVINTDTSSGATTTQPLLLANPANLPQIESFVYVAPLDAYGNAYYGANFDLAWVCSNTAYVTFTASDQTISSYLAPPINSQWPSAGNLATPVFEQYTTFTLTAYSQCGASTQTTIEVTQPPALETQGLQILPQTLVIFNQEAYYFTVSRIVLNAETQQLEYIDITQDPNTIYNYYDSSSQNIISLFGNTVSPIKNGNARVQVLWKGYVANLNVFVNLAVPVGLLVAPGDINFSTNYSTQQLSVIVEFSDGSQEDVTAVCSYIDYDPTQISVSATGLVTAKIQNVNTSIRCVYVVQSIDSSAVVEGIVNIGEIPQPIQISNVQFNPQYALAKTPNSELIKWVVTGVNAQTQVVATDNLGISSFQYNGINPGKDIIQAFLPNSTTPAQTNEIIWNVESAGLAVYNIVANVYGTNNTSGVFDFSPFNGLVFQQNINSLTLNVPNTSFIPNYPANSNNDMLRPVVSAVINAAGDFVGTQVLSGSGFQAGIGTLAAFQTAIVGQFVVSTPQVYTFQIYSIGGFVFGVSNGAILSNGVQYGNPPSNLTYLEGYPVMGAVNGGIEQSTVTGGYYYLSNQSSGGTVIGAPTTQTFSVQSLDTSPYASIAVNFPVAGVYNFELDYAAPALGPLGIFVAVAELGNVTPPPTSSTFVPFEFSTTANSLSVNSSNNYVVYNTSETVNDFLVGTGVEFKYFAGTGAEDTANVALLLSGTNVQNVMVDGVQVVNQAIGNLQYSNTYTLGTPEKFDLVVSNSGSSLSISAYANIVSFPDAVITAFGLYNAKTNSALPNFTEQQQTYLYINSNLSVNYSDLVGVVWEVQNATSVTLTDPSGTVYNLSDTGSLYVSVYEGGAFTLSATSMSKKVIQQVIGVGVVGSSTQKVTNSNSIIQIGQNITLTPPIGGEQYTITANSDVDFVYDAQKPVQGPTVTLTPINSYFQGPVVVSPKTNTFYNFLITTQISIESLGNTLGSPVYSTTSTFNDPLYGITTGGLIKPSYYGTRLSNASVYIDPITVTSVYSTVTVQYSACVNVDIGPTIIFLNVSNSNVNYFNVVYGAQLTISYQTQNAVSFYCQLFNDYLPVGSGTFTINAVASGSYRFIATSVTGLQTYSYITINVVPQILNSNGNFIVVPQPVVDYISLNGNASTNTGYLATANENQSLYTLEIFGNNFIVNTVDTYISASPTNPQTAQIIIYSPQPGVPSKLQLISINSMSDSYIQATIQVNDYTSSGIYKVAVLTEAGISNFNNVAAWFEVDVTVPEFLTIDFVSGYPGEIISLYIDSYDSIRDVGIYLLINGTKTTLYSIGSNQDNSDFVQTLYSNIFGGSISTTLLNASVLNLENATITRRGLLNSFLAMPNANQSANITAGTRISVVINETSVCGINLVTDNGISPIPLTFVPQPPPPQPTIVPTTNIKILGVSPTSGGVGETISIIGENFSSTDLVKVGNTVVQPTFISNEQLNIVLPSSAASLGLSPSASILLAPTESGPFQVMHGLGTTPGSVFIQMISNGEIWFQPALYDSTYIYLNASSAGALGYAELFLGSSAATINVTAPSFGDFQVAHNLGTTPSAAFIQMTSDGEIWFQPIRYDGSNIYLNASFAGITATIQVFTNSTFAASFAIDTTGSGNFQIAHGLNTVPSSVILQMTSDGEIWFQPALYDAKYIYLTCSGSAVTGYALVSTAESVMTTIVVYSSNSQDIYQYFYLIAPSIYTNELFVTNLLMDATSYQNYVNTQDLYSSGNQGVRDTYLLPPTVQYSVYALRNLTAKNILPVPGGYNYQPNSNYFMSTISTIEYNYNEVSDPNSITLETLNHVSLTSTPTN